MEADVPDSVTLICAEEVIPAAERVPVMLAGPPTTRLAVASMLETEIVPGSRSLLRVPEVTLDAFRSFIPSPEPIKSAALKVPVMFAGPPTTRFAVASMLETEIVPGSRSLLRVPEVTLDAFRSFIPSPEPIKSAALKVPVMFAGPPTTKLAVASTLATEMVPGSRSLLRVPEVTFDAFRSFIPSPEPIKSAALKVPVMSAGPPTTKLAVASTLATEMVPGSLRLSRVPEVMFDAFRSFIPSPEPIKSRALRVPVMSAGPPTTRFAVASMLETEMVPGSLRLSRVPEVMFDAFRSFIPSPEPIKSRALRVPVMSAGPPTTRFACRFNIGN